MRILINSLSAESLSGKHVLYGHLAQLAQWSRDEHQFEVIYNDATRPDEMNMGTNVHWHRSPASVRGWLRRFAWESTALPKLMCKWGIDLYFTPAGTILPRSPVPQVSLAQNPWCLTNAVPRTMPESMKAALQRRAYRTAQQSAELMIYNSRHMQQLYRSNAAGQCERRGLVVYQAIDDSVHNCATRNRRTWNERELTIVCVSVMARWKNCESLLAALRTLHDRGIDAKLRLIGKWPDATYRQEIEALIERLTLSEHVLIEGHLSREKLHEAYATSKVYCLLSRCESFGIPAIEAQAFGTPVVGSSAGAMSEIGGSGGLYVQPDDLTGAALALERLITDEYAWTSCSAAAVTNAERFRWNQCSRPLTEMFSLVSGSASGQRPDSIPLNSSREPQESAL